MHYPRILCLLALFALLFASITTGEELAPELTRTRTKLDENLPETVLVKQAASWLIANAKRDNKVLEWREYAEHPFVTLTLYSGAPGVLHALLSLYNTTGDETYRALAVETVEAIRKASFRDNGKLTWKFAWDDAEEKVHTKFATSLYSGASGVAVALLEAGEILNLPDATKDGIEALSWVADRAETKNDGATWEYGFTDIISGNAGIICAMLRGYELTGEAFMLNTARMAGEYLISFADKTEKGWSWLSMKGATKTYNGFAHGTAGVAWSLARLALFTGDEKFLNAAIKGADTLDACAVRDAKGTRWHQFAVPEATASPREGWCHGVAGTARLYMLLHSITGDVKYLQTAEDGAKWLIASYFPKQDRARSRFYSPSLCCGAAGVGDLMLDMYRFTGNKEYLDYTVDVAGWLAQIATRTKAGGAAWNLTPVPSEKHGVMHPMSLMLGVSGHISFLTRLAALRSGCAATAVLTADRLGIGGKSHNRMIVVLFGPGSMQYRKAAYELSAYRNCDMIAIENGDVADLKAVVRRFRADSVAIVVSPRYLDFNLHRRVISALCEIDDDPFCDAGFGYITGASVEDPLRMLDSMAYVEAKGLPSSALNVSVASSIEKLLVLPPSPHHSPLAAENKILQERIYLTCNDKNANCRDDLKAVVAKMKDRGLIELFGCGDPIKTWLFSDQRNMDRDKHWPFDPQKVRDSLDDPEMPGFGAADYTGVSLAPAVVATGVCHHGVPLRALVEGDIVSTFGETSGVSRFYEMKPSQSYCLNMLARAPSAYLAAIGANHGHMSSLDIYRAMVEGISLGESIRRGVNDVVEAYLSSDGKGVPLFQVEDGKGDKIYGASHAMRMGRLNRILYGDPTYEPLATTSPRSLPFSLDNLKGNKVLSVWSLAVKDTNSPEFWDMYRGDAALRERIGAVIALDNPALWPEKVTVKATYNDAAHKLTRGEWSIENTRRHGRLLHVQVNAPGLANYKLNLWRAGIKVYISVHLAKDKKSGFALAQVLDGE